MDEKFVDSLTTAAGTALGGLPGAIIGNAVGGLFGSIFGGSSAKKQFKYQSKLQQQQFDLQKQMFDYTSEYNSPVNAVQRYKDAGLNPNLLTGQTQNVGSTGSISQGNAPTPFVQMNGDMSRYIQANNQSKLTESEIRLRNSQSDLNYYLSITESFKAMSEQTKAKYADKLAQLGIDLLEKNIVTEHNRGILLGEQAINEIARRYQIEAETMRTIAQGITESLQPFVILQQLRESQSRIETAKFYRAYLSAAKEELEAKASLYGSEEEINKVVKEIKDKENDNWKITTNAELEALGAKVYNLMSERNGGAIGPFKWNTTSRPKKDYTPYRVY